MPSGIDSQWGGLWGPMWRSLGSFRLLIHSQPTMLLDTSQEACKVRQRLLVMKFISCLLHVIALLLAAIHGYNIQQHSKRSACKTCQHVKQQGLSSNYGWGAYSGHYQYHNWKWWCWWRKANENDVISLGQGGYQYQRNQGGPSLPSVLKPMHVWLYQTQGAGTEDTVGMPPRVQTEMCHKQIPASMRWSHQGILVTEKEILKAWYVIFR
jgi:hypothetical protein